MTLDRNLCQDLCQHICQHICQHLYRDLYRNLCMPAAAFTQGRSLGELLASSAMRSTGDLAIEPAQPDTRMSRPRRFTRTLAAICRPRMLEGKAA